VTQSSITAPSDPFYVLSQGQVQSVTISGTSDGTASDDVDIRCYTGAATGTTPVTAVASNVAVGSDGSFTTSVPITTLNLNLTPLCRLRAVPSGVAPTTGLDAYAGPRDAYTRLLKSVTIHGGHLDDFDLTATELGAVDDLTAAGDCGLEAVDLFDPSVAGQEDTTTFACNDYVEMQSESNATAPGITVDGHPGYTPTEASAANPVNNGSAPGFPSVTIVSAAEDSSTGDLTLVETEPIVTCSGNAPPPIASCSTWIASHVLLTRTVLVSDHGLVVEFKDAYSSTDAATHTVSLLLNNSQVFSLGPNSHVGYQFPGQSSFSESTLGETVSVPAGAPATIYLKNDALADGSTAGGVGAITYYQPPSGPFAFSAVASQFSDFPNDFDAPNQLTVPATGTANLDYVYTSGYTLGAVQSQVADVLTPPAVSMTSPDSGATESSSPVTVTGTAVAGSGVQSVTVNGVAATVSNGTFTASVPLVAGSNTITVVLTTLSGATASSSETVTYTPPTPPPPTGPTPPPPTGPTPPPPTGPTAPVNTGAPAITGTAAVGHTLTISTGSWSGTTTAFSYQWLRDGMPIPGATDSSYTVQTADQGHSLTCEVTASDGSSTGASTSSASPAVTVPIVNVQACPKPTGRLNGTSLGPVALGLTQARARRTLPRFEVRSYHTDNFCLSGGWGIRVGYASEKLLGTTSRGELAKINGKIVLALTANPYYKLNSVRNGTRLSTAAHQLKLGKPVHWGLNDWYVIPGATSNRVLKVRHGVVREVGIANKQLTTGRAAQQRLLRNF
jgi:hypothetical protein